MQTITPSSGAIVLYFSMFVVCSGMRQPLRLGYKYSENSEPWAPKTIEDESVQGSIYYT